MGSVSMQSQAGSRGERMSAFVDGESFGEEHLGIIGQFLCGLEESRIVPRGRDYHLIGDALRSDDLAVSPATSSAFMAAFSQRFEAEAHVLAPAALPVLAAGALLAAAPSRRAGFRGRRRCCHADVDRRAATAGRRQPVRAARRSRRIAPADSMQRVAMASVPAATARPAVQSTRTSSATRVSISISKLISSSRNNRSCPARCR